MIAVAKPAFTPQLSDQWKSWSRGGECTPAEADESWLACFCRFSVGSSDALHCSLEFHGVGMDAWTLRLRLGY